MGWAGGWELSRDPLAMGPGRSSWPRVALWFLRKSDANIWWPHWFIASLRSFAEQAGWWDGGSFPHPDPFSVS